MQRELQNLLAVTVRGDPRAVWCAFRREILLLAKK
jgi:hypothetical protein